MVQYYGDFWAHNFSVSKHWSAIWFRVKAAWLCTLFNGLHYFHIQILPSASITFILKTVYPYISVWKVIGPLQRKRSSYITVIMACQGWTSVLSYDNGFVVLKTSEDSIFVSVHIVWWPLINKHTFWERCFAAGIFLRENQENFVENSEEIPGYKFRIFSPKTTENHMAGRI